MYIRCKASYNKDKLFLFFTPKEEYIDKQLGKVESKQVIVNSVAVSAKK